MRAAHLAGDRIKLKSPRSLITDLASMRAPLNVKGAMNQQVWDLSEEWEKPRNYSVY